MVISYGDVVERGLGTAGELHADVAGAERLTWELVYGSSFLNFPEPPLCVFQQRLVVCLTPPFVAQVQQLRAAVLGYTWHDSVPLGVEPANLTPPDVDILDGWSQVATAIKRCAEDLPSGQLWCWSPATAKPVPIRAMLRASTVTFALPAELAGKLQSVWGKAHRERTVSEEPD